VRGALPADAGGPRITLADFRRATVFAGEAGLRISGRAESAAFALNLALEGERGYWIVPTGVEDPSVPGELSWSAELDFGRALSPARRRLLIQAADARGRAGPVRRVNFEVAAAGAEGELVVELVWDAQADVDLIVTDPEGSTISPRNIDSQPGAQDPEPDASASGGRMDVDSNANCLIDGRRREAVVWAREPPAGRYTVRVDLAAPCDQSRVSYRLSVKHLGRQIATAAGALYPIDARQTHAGGGVGLIVASFELPAGADR